MPRGGPLHPRRIDDGRFARRPRDSHRRQRRSDQRAHDGDPRPVCRPALSRPIPTLIPTEASTLCSYLVRQGGTNMKALILTTLVGALAMPATSATTALLDGQTFSGPFGLKGKGAEAKDDVIFANGTLHSTGCDAYGYGPGRYTAARNGDTINFTATTTSPKNGTIEWQGTVRNGVLEGTFVCKRLGGLIRRNYWIKATQE